MSNKSQTGLIIFIVIAVIILIIGIVLFIVFQKGYTRFNEPKINITYLDLYFQTKDIKTNQPVIANYIIFNSTGILQEGTTIQNETREIKLNINDSYMFTCWSEDYYLRKAYPLFSQHSIKEKKATFSCDMNKIEKELKVEIKGNINNEYSNIRLNITSKSKFQALHICTSWTSGFISVILENNLINCKQSWRNYTELNKTTGKLEYLEKGLYLCGNITEGIIENCTNVFGTKCEPVSIKEPTRFIRKVDKCYNTGINLDDSSTELSFLVKKSEFTNRNDYVTFYFYDWDRRYIREKDTFEWVNEINGIDIASPDLNISVYYE